MSSAKKYIWSVYIILWVYFIIFDSSYEQSDHIALYLVFGWIPFVILHFLWRAPKASNVDASTQRTDGLDENYSLLYSLIPKQELIDIGALNKQVEAGLGQARAEMDNFLKKYRRNQEFFESDEALDLEVEVLEEFYKLDHQIKQFHLANHKIQKFFERAGLINEDLKSGLSDEEAQKKLNELSEKHGEVTAEIEVKLEFSKAIGDEFTAMKRLYGKDFKGKTVNMDDVIKRVLEEHPQWKG